MVRIGIVAGEASVICLQSSHSGIEEKTHRHRICRHCRSKNDGRGCAVTVSIERLSIRGYFEVIKHLFGLLKLRRQLLKHFLNNRLDLFIGIDARTLIFG